MATKKYQADFTDSKLVELKPSYKNFTGVSMSGTTRRVKGMQIECILFEIDSKADPKIELKKILKNAKLKFDLG